MILIDIIRKVDNQYTYYYLLDSVFSVQKEAFSSDAFFLIKMNKLKVQLLCHVLEDFLILLNKEKCDLLPVKERQVKLKSFLESALRSDNPTKTLESFLKVPKFMENICKSMPDSENKEILFFYSKIVTFNLNHRISI